MAAGAQDAHALHQLHLAVHLGQLSGGAHGVELPDLHDARQAKLVAVRRLRLVALNDVAGVGECRPSIGADHAAGVVVVEMAEDDEVDRRRILPHGPQCRRRVAALDALDVPILVAHPRPGAGLDQDALATGLDQQQVQAAEEPAALIGLHQPAPQGLRHDAEEAPRVRTEPAGPHHPDAWRRRRSFSAPRSRAAARSPDHAAALEVGVVAAGGRIGLAKVLAADPRVAVADLDWRAEALEADLADLHAVVQLDRQVGDVAELQRERALPARVDVAGGRVDEQSEAAQARLALEPRDQVVR